MEFFWRVCTATKFGRRMESDVLTAENQERERDHIFISFQALITSCQPFHSLSLVPGTLTKTVPSCLIILSVQSALFSTFNHYCTLPWRNPSWSDPLISRRWPRRPTPTSWPAWAGRKAVAAGAVMWRACQGTSLSWDGLLGARLEEVSSIISVENGADTFLVS